MLEAFAQIYLHPSRHLFLPWPVHAAWMLKPWPSRMAGVTLVLMASQILHASQAPYAEAGHFWDEVGSDFHGDRLMFMDVYVEICRSLSTVETRWLVSGDLCLLSARKPGIRSNWVC